MATNSSSERSRVIKVPSIMHQNAFFSASISAYSLKISWLLKKSRSTMRDMLHRTERRLEGFIVWVSSCFILVKMWFCAFFHVPYKQTVPLSKRPHYSHKSINDRCSQKMEKTETEKELKWVSFFFFLGQIALLFCYYTVLPPPETLFYLQRKFSFQEIISVLSWEVVLCGLWWHVK